MELINTSIKSHYCENQINTSKVRGHYPGYAKYFQSSKVTIDSVPAMSHHPKTMFCTLLQCSLFCKQWILYTRTTKGTTKGHQQNSTKFFPLIFWSGKQNRTRLFMSLKIVTVICLLLPQSRGPLRYAICCSQEVSRLQRVFEIVVTISFMIT